MSRCGSIFQHHRDIEYYSKNYEDPCFYIFKSKLIMIVFAFSNKDFRSI